MKHIRFFRLLLLVTVAALMATSLGVMSDRSVKSVGKDRKSVV